MIYRSMFLFFMCLWQEGQEKWLSFHAACSPFLCCTLELSFSATFQAAMHLHPSECSSSGRRMRHNHPCAQCQPNPCQCSLLLHPYLLHPYTSSSTCQHAGMVVPAGPYLYYWHDLNTLMRVTVASGAAAHVPEQVLNANGYPSWALHVPVASASTQATLYFKRSYDETRVDVFHLGSGAHSTLEVSKHINCTYLMACTGEPQVCDEARESAVAVGPVTASSPPTAAGWCPWWWRYGRFAM